MELESCQYSNEFCDKSNVANNVNRCDRDECGLQVMEDIEQAASERADMLERQEQSAKAEEALPDQPHLGTEKVGVRFTACPPTRKQAWTAFVQGDLSSGVYPNKVRP